MARPDEDHPPLLCAQLHNESSMQVAGWSCNTDDLLDDPRCATGSGMVSAVLATMDEEEDDELDSKAQQSHSHLAVDGRFGGGGGVESGSC
jgi:hypothetical protein